MTDRKANRDYYRAHQRCTKCGQQDAFTLNGRSLCADCMEKKQIREQRYREEHREKINAYNIAWTQKRKDAGLCPKCGRKPEGDYVYCARCRARDNARRRKKLYRDYDGICWTCKKRPLMQGKKLCRECYEQSCRNLAKARAAVEDRDRFVSWLYRKRHLRNPQENP